MDLEFWKFFAGLGIFLFSFSLIEDSLKTLGSKKFKLILRKHTTNHFKAILIGTGATTILQSSSVVTLMLLALVGSQIINLSNALGIVIGANLGTTFTGWIVTYLGFNLNLTKAIYPIIAFGSLIYIFFSANQIITNWGKLILGLGFLLFGLDFMKDSMASLQKLFDPAALQNYHYIIFAVFGMFFTALIQSSSATMAITLTALSGQLITLENACALIIGADLGTTITAVLGSLSGGYRKKQVAAAHFIYNLIIDICALIFLYPLLKLIFLLIGTDKPLYSLVLFHSSFNLIGIFIFFPFLRYFSDFLNSMFVKDDRSLILDITPQIPEAAILSLKQAVKSYLHKSFILNASLMKYKSSGKLKAEFGKADYLECYRKHKEIESSLLEYSIKLQEQRLTGEQSLELKQILSCARNCVISAKALKDIKHNLDDFEESLESSVTQISNNMILSFAEFYKIIEDILLQEEKSPVIFEEFIDLEKLC